MPELADSFSRLLGRQPNEAERRRLYEVRDTLGLSANDALWVVLLALQHHQVLYEEIPAKIREAAEAALSHVKESADAAVRASAEDVRAEVTRAVTRLYADVARLAARRQSLRWAFAAFVTAFLCLGGAAIAGYTVGHQRGLASARDEQAAAEWANTAEGRLARQLAQGGSLEELAHCSGPGWTLSKSICYPNTTPDGRVYGWRVSGGTP